MQSFAAKQRVLAGVGKSAGASLDQQETLTGVSLSMAVLFCPGDQPCLSPEDMPAGSSSSSSSQTCAFPGQRFQLAPLDCCLHGPGGQGSAVEMWHWGFFSSNPSVLRNSHDGVTALIIPPEGLGELGTGMLQLCW